MERSTRKLLKSMKLAGTPEQELLIVKVLAGARALDEALETGRPLGPPHAVHEAALKALQATVPPPPEFAKKAADDGEDLDEWSEAMHRPTIRCQKDFPLVTPGDCAECDKAPGARASYGRRHPEEQGHEFGMSRSECGCARCAQELAQAAGHAEQDGRLPEESDL